MGEAESKVLQMLEDGSITAEEAETLLAAIGQEERGTGYVDGENITPDMPKAVPYETPPERTRFRRFWKIPFFIAAGSLLLSAFGLALMYQSAGQVALIGFICVWGIFLVALLATVLMLMVRKAPWFHLRIQEINGRRFAISFPLPLSLARWILPIAKIFVPDEQAAYLEMAAAIVKQMTNDPDQEPIMIDVEDEDGDRVQVYFG
jgi:hypothetical protein